MNVLTEVLSPTFLLRDALYTSVVIGLACPVVGVFLVLVPVSQLTGANHAGTIGTLKGQVDALNARLLACK